MIFLMLRVLAKLAPIFGSDCERTDWKEKTTSIGALYNQLNERLLEELYGAEISISKP